MYRRNLAGQLLEALSDTPVVLLHGARQTGKSTLARWLATEGRPARYVTLDDAAALASARNDAAGFLAGLDGPLVLDEAQRAPELFLAIKADVDRNRRPGRFLLTGSANVLLLPHLAEALAGRMEILTLWPLSQGEIAGVQENFIDAVFAPKMPSLRPVSRSKDKFALLHCALTGGYPAALARSTSARRRAWFGSYITTVLQRDVRDLAQIEALTSMPRLLALLAARTASLLNFADISRSIGMPQTTLKRYLTLLEATFLVLTVPAWSANLGNRLVKSPKLILNDTGLTAALLGLDEKRLANDPTLAGPLLESFVAMELRKQAAWSRVSAQLFHFRLQTGPEVDLLLEDAAGSIVGVEVKASATVGTADFKGLGILAEIAGRRFRRGILLYSGTEPVSFGRNLHAVPLDFLFERL